MRPVPRVVNNVVVVVVSPVSPVRAAMSVVMRVVVEVVQPVPETRDGPDPAQARLHRLEVGPARRGRETVAVQLVAGGAAVVGGEEVSQEELLGGLGLGRGGGGGGGGGCGGGGDLAGQDGAV